MKNSRLTRPILALIAIAILATPVVAGQQCPVPEQETYEKMLSEKYKGKAYSPYAKRDFSNELLWGDSHLHTGLSFDAGTVGCTLMPGDAYRFRPHTVHRVTAIEDTLVVEVSTNHLYDVVRLEDRYGREGTSAP